MASLETHLYSSAVILLIRKELKAQTDIAKKQYQKLDDTFEFNKITKKEKPTSKRYTRSNLIYGSKYSFYPYYNIKNVILFLLHQNIQLYYCSIMN